MRNRAGEAGGGVVGLLLVMTILGLLGAGTMMSLSGPATTADLPAVPPASAGPAPTGPAGTGPAGTGPAGAGPAGVRPASLPDIAAATACEAQVRAVEQAVQAASATTGRYPTDFATLVGAGLLPAAPTDGRYRVRLEVIGGRGTGRVLVDGRPGREGCSALVR